MNKYEFKRQFENEIIKMLLIVAIVMVSVTLTLASYYNDCKKEQLKTSTICEVSLDINSGYCQTVEKHFYKLNKYLGKFMITSYCACEKCCGKTDGITATGTKVEEGRTIAVDPDVIPYGSKILINGKEYIAEDCGGAINGNHIDIYIASHERALQYGVYYADIYLVRG